MGHDIVNFYKARFKIVIRGGFDDGGLNESTSVYVSRPVDQTGGGPVVAVGFVTLVDKNIIVTIGTMYGIFLLGNTLIYACSRFTNILLVAGRAGNSVNTHLTFIRR